jgi:ribosomal protein S18 acetylase RimI-like enzyme
MSCVRRARAQDTATMASFLGRFPEVAMLDGQGAEGLRTALLAATTIALMAEDDEGCIVGALIGGVMGTRGTINHVAVDEGHRDRGVGGQLVEAFEHELRQRGVRRYFLFVTRSNARARSFWASRGLAATTRLESTYERDL